MKRIYNLLITHMKTSTVLMAFTTLAIHILLLMTAFTLNQKHIATIHTESTPSFLGAFTHMTTD